MTLGFGDVQKAFLADICTFSGATLITDELKMKVEEATLAQLGSLSRVKVEKAKTLLVSDGTHQADCMHARAHNMHKHMHICTTRTCAQHAHAHAHVHACLW